MTKREEVVRKAREWLGTPFAHQGRTKGVGVDCIGSLTVVAKEVGALEYVDLLDYPRVPMDGELLRRAHEHLDPISLKEALPADILVFRLDRAPQHFALITESTPRLRMLHSWCHPSVMKVVEHDVDRFWRQRIISCFRFRGID